MFGADKVARQVNNRHAWGGTVAIEDRGSTIEDGPSEAQWRFAEAAKL